MQEMKIDMLVLARQVIRFCLCSGCCVYQENMSLCQIVLNWRFHCSQDAVIGSQLPCPPTKNVLLVAVLVQIFHCTSQQHPTFASFALSGIDSAF